MPASHALLLHHELLLLALRDQEGTLEDPASSYWDAGLAAGILAELLIDGAIEDRNGIVSVAPDAAPENPLLDEWVRRIHRHGGQSLAKWGIEIATTKGLNHRVAEELVDKGILGKNEDRVMLVFSRRTYPEKNPEPEKQLVERLRQAIFTDMNPIPARTAAVVWLAHDANLLEIKFGKGELEARAERIQAIADMKFTDESDPAAAHLRALMSGIAAG